ncbi:HesA/MoeB/ThiF family protein [Palleniella muris]|uniref:HesA/MoeB/ThiF family protein n=1 Tax=Palleniella muris TaxID=3038145 RepID=A0AC61QQW7_9BACT|nr:HesA/MoeB/ThiF family protein [Palleniella muris]TGX82647.1 HesA/MoeB/ThiF family protein [Palleniella muris]
MESRYARQLILPEIGIEGQRRLAEARVMIVGAGGLGSPVAAYLAGAGVGTIGIVDDDVVSVSNLQRQVLYDEGMVGRAKALCAKERLSALNSGIIVNAYNERLTSCNAARLIGCYDIVVDCTDNFAVRYVISDTCHAQCKPMVYGAVCAFEGQVSVLCKGHATYRTLYPDEGAIQAMPHSGKEIVGVTPAVVGSVQAAQVVQLICSYGEPLIDRLWSIDLRTMWSFVVNI